MSKSKFLAWFKSTFKPRTLKTVFSIYNRVYMFTIALVWEPRDLWIGIYPDYHQTETAGYIKVYITIFPCLPLRIHYQWFEHVPTDMHGRLTNHPEETQCHQDGCKEMAWLCEDQGGGYCTYECPTHGSFGIQFDDDEDDYEPEYYGDYNDYDDLDDSDIGF